MIRLNRAGREAAIVEALKRLHTEKKHNAFLAGEICKKMGIQSQSKIKYILRDMAKRNMIAMGTSAIDSFNFELEVYALMPKQQEEIRFHEVLINGAKWMMDDGKAVQK